MSSAQQTLPQPRVFSNLPSGWREERLNDIAELRTSNVDKKSAEGEKPVKLCNYVDVYYNDCITSKIDFMDATATDLQIDRFTLRVGDVVFTKDSESPDDIGIPSLVSEAISGLVCGYHLAILRPDEALIDGSYLFYALVSGRSAYQFYLAANGVTRFGLTLQGTKNIRIAFPSAQEQQQIAAFLDWKTGQIDALIAKKKELLGKLKEKRLAVITQAVTKGLDSDVPMRDSGIPWLGDVPKHWEVKRLKWAIMLQRGHDLPAEERGQGEVPLVSSAGISSLHDVAIAKAPGIVTGRYGTIGVFHLIEEDYWPLNTTLYSIELYGNCPRFIRALLESLSALFLINAKKSAVPGVDRNDVHSIAVAMPSKIEQIAIADHIAIAETNIAAMCEKTESAITRLTEYRTALITAATTGKIDARQVAVPAAT